MSAATLPAGSQLIARLETPVSNRGAKAGEQIRAAVVGAVDGEALWTAAADLVIEGNVSGTGHRGVGRRSLLTIRFDRIRTGENVISVRLRLTEIDNAPESVDRQGMIQGANPWTARRGKPEDALLLATPVVPIVLLPWSASKLVLSGIIHPPIRLASGQELRLTTEEPMEVPGLRPVVAGSTAELETLIKSQPARTTAHGGRHVSDVINVALIGSGDEIAHAFEAADWSRPDSLSPKSDVKVFAALAHPHTYRTAPVSRLLLEGRKPDLVFERQNRGIAKRHHVRLWLMSATYQGRPLWLGAGTHDVRIAVRRRALGLTHAVHGEIDQERTKIVLDLAAARWVDKVAVIDRGDALRHTRNGTGDHLETDGRLAVIELQPPDSNAAAQTEKADGIPEVF